jgi:hypothetical protein
VALDHVFVEARVEEAVNGIEELVLGQPFSLMADQMLENAQFATRKRQRPAADLGVPAVEENADQAGCRFVGAAAGSPANDRGANQDLANVNRDVDDIVDPGLEQFDGVLKLFQVVEGDDRRPRPVANALRNAGAVRAVT